MKRPDLLSDYITEVNTPSFNPTQKVFRMKIMMRKHLEYLLIKTLVISITIYTLKVAIEQMIMQWRIHF